MNYWFQELTSEQHYIEPEISQQDPSKYYKVVDSSLNSIFTVNKAMDDETERYIILETYLDGCIELSFLFDYVSDCVVLYQMS